MSTVHEYIEQELKELSDKYGNFPAYSSYDSGKFDALTDFRKWYSDMLADTAKEVMDEIVQEESELEQLRVENMRMKHFIAMAAYASKTGYVAHDQGDFHQSVMQFILIGAALKNAYPDVDDYVKTIEEIQESKRNG